MNRREAMKRLGAAAAAASPLVGQLRFHPLVPVQEGGFRPRFLEESELVAVAALAERILPATDTPGAREANVHQYVDFALSRAEPEARDRFREGLKRLEAKSRSSFGSAIADLDAGRQDELLAPLAASAPSSSDEPAVAFVFELKRLTVEGYYRSEAGMMNELGFQGNTHLAEFDGCRHDAHRSWKPEG
jgi:glucoside 3-dehydrogenase (cytochrome c) hitch-hiker subunit